VDDQIRLMNEAFIEALDTPGLTKKATDLADEYTRTKIREEGFYRKLIEHEPISNDRLVRRLDTDKPYYIVDKEPDCPASVTVGFRTLPNGVYLRGKRYPVYFDRIQTEKFMKDVEELRTYHMDLRQVMSDNSIREIHTEEDDGWLDAVDTCLGAVDTAQDFSGVVQWETIPGGITRESYEDALKIMPRTPSRLEVNTILVNNITIREILKWGRDEVGGDKSQDMLVNGWTDSEFGKVKFIITIKHELVPEDVFYMFAHQKFVGKAFELVPPTMYVDRKAFLIEWWTYETIGGAIGHTGGLAKATFVG
jgi:hypothetical protein